MGGRAWKGEARETTVASVWSIMFLEKLIVT
jgi:hypothetical protein